MRTRKPSGAAILRELMRLHANWAVGRFPVRAFADEDPYFPKTDETPVTAIMLGARFAAAVLGPYAEELLPLLTDAARGNPDVEKVGALFSVGSTMSTKTIQRAFPEDPEWIRTFPDELDEAMCKSLGLVLRRVLPAQPQVVAVDHLLA